MTSFDGALASTLYPRMISLAQLSTTSSISSSPPSATRVNEVEARATKLEINKQASQLRTTLQTLQSQASRLEAGEMSLEDQDWLIGELRRELDKKRKEMDQMVKLTSFDGVKDIEAPTTTENDDSTTAMQTES